MRTDDRKPRQLRPLTITPGYLKTADGSVLIEVGIPKSFVRRSSKSASRNSCVTAGRVGLRPSMECSRALLRCALGARRRVGRSAGEPTRFSASSVGACRAIADLKRLGEKDDLGRLRRDPGRWRYADGVDHGCLRGASEAVAAWLTKGILAADPIKDSVAAVSVGIIDGKVLLDLSYEEDSRADVDMNFVMTGSGKFVEVQGTAESAPFTSKQMERMTEIAQEGFVSCSKRRRKFSPRSPEL